MKTNINDMSVFAIGKLQETLDKVGHFPTHVFYRDKLSLDEIYSDEACIHIERTTIPCLIARSLCRAVINFQSISSRDVDTDRLIGVIKPVIGQLVNYIQAARRSGGHWNYAVEVNDRSLPDDLDDTALAIETLGLYYKQIHPDPPKLQELRGGLIKLTLRQARRVREVEQSTEFAYKTWITELEDWSNIDLVVNGHISSAVLTFDMPELVPEDYIESQLEHVKSSTVANMSAGEYVSDFYCRSGIFWYALAPYCEYNSQPIAGLLPIVEAQNSLLSKIFQTIFLFASKSVLDKGLKENLLQDIFHKITSLESIDPLYIENSRPQLTLYAFSPELYFALLLELISLQIKDE